MELYKKYRPRSLKTVIGNQATVKTLANMFERGTLPHTILLHGESGTGKTTIARIIKKELECSDVDFKEVNCSDNRGIDTIREIRRIMNMKPTGGDVRIWLLDECHRLTGEAMDAALKILEDTPSHVYFILCTTDPQKLIKTIKTRCCQLPMELLSDNDEKRLIQRVLKKEEEELDDDLIDKIIDAANGSSRKALVILDRVLNLPPEDRESAVSEEPEEKEVIDLCRALIKGESWSKVAKMLKELKVEPESIRYVVLGYARSCLLGGGAVSKKAALIIDAFSRNFYDSKNAGLALACYEVVVGFD